MLSLPSLPPALLHLRARVTARFGLPLVPFILLLGLLAALLTVGLDLLLPVVLRAAPHHVDRHRLQSYAVQTVLIAPPVEEALTRGLPLLVLRRAHLERWMWPAGLVTSALFALGHTPLAHWPFHFPVIQFLFGLTAWSVARTSGLRYSILLHVTVNALLTLPLFLLL